MRVKTKDERGAGPIGWSGLKSMVKETSVCENANTELIFQIYFANVQNDGPLGLSCM